MSHRRTFRALVPGLAACVAAAVIVSASLRVRTPVQAQQSALHDDAAQRLDAGAGKACDDAAATSAARDTRTAGATALYDIAQDGNASRALPLLDREYAAQIVDPRSAQYGAIVDPAVPLDRNDTAFGVQAWGPILLRYGSRMSPEAASELRAHAAAALVYLEHHEVSVDYTNIHLLISSEEVILGGVLGDAIAEGRGMAGLDQWIAAVQANGIREFESPTYYAGDIQFLQEGATFAPEPAQRAEFATALNYVWRELGANLFLPKMRIAGAQSRSYDFLSGSDEMTQVLFNHDGALGVMRDAPAETCFDVYSVLDEVGASAMPQAARDLAALVPRIVEQRWSADPQATKYTYITSQYAIGSSNESYGTTERIAAIDFAGGSRAVVPIRVGADKTGYWYGPTPKVQLDHEGVWDHVLTRPATVQRENLLLVMTDLDGAAPADGGPLSLDVIVPAKEDAIAVDGKPIALTPALDRNLGTSDVVTVQVGSTVAAVRIAYADFAPGGPQRAALSTDAPALAKGVARLVLEQASTTPSASRDLCAILLFGVDSGEAGTRIGKALAEATVVSQRSGNLWEVTAKVGNHTLTAAYDLTTHKSVQRAVDGRPVYVPFPLIVNGSGVAL